MRRFATGLAVTQTLLIVGVVLWTTGTGCNKNETPSAPATAPTDQQAAVSEPPAPPAYKIPDTLPAPGTVKLAKQENGTSVYKASWFTTFSFDAKQAALGLDVNTVGWIYKGRIIITNKDDDESVGSELHEQLYPTQPPTTQGLDLPAEHLELHDDEKQWIKDGGITITIRNDESTPGPAPTIQSADLVQWDKPGQ